MDMRERYLRDILPRLSVPLAEKYPLVRLVDRGGCHPLGEHPVLMIVALTGTGKSTALEIVRARTGGRGMSLVPTRREVADWIAIPVAQSLADEPLAAVPDRVQRFELTRRFAREVPGGMAAAFSWLRLADSQRCLILSEGIRGRSELGYALRHFPRWKILELSLPPLTRLRRLSGRGDAFDQAGEDADVDFLPRALRARARALLAAGEITSKALAIAQAEAANYGLDAFADGGSYRQYRRLDVAGMQPEAVADVIIAVMDGG